VYVGILIVGSLFVWHVDGQRRRFNSIHVGMTEREVIAILGAPGREIALDYACARGVDEDHMLEWPTWRDEEWYIVIFDSQGRVVRIKIDDV
jgi:hypothetical protein